MIDHKELRRLAEAARDANPYSWSFRTMAFTDEEVALTLAANPSTIIALLDEMKLNELDFRTAFGNLKDELKQERSECQYQEQRRAEEAASFARQIECLEAQLAEAYRALADDNGFGSEQWAELHIDALNHAYDFVDAQVIE